MTCGNVYDVAHSLEKDKFTSEISAQVEKVLKEEPADEKDRLLRLWKLIDESFDAAGPDGVAKVLSDSWKSESDRLEAALGHLSRLL
jgi:hypothetical protein